MGRVQQPFKPDEKDVDLALASLPNLRKVGLEITEEFKNLPPHKKEKALSDAENILLVIHFALQKLREGHEPRRPLLPRDNGR